MNNNRYYLLTGAAGFLGTNICMQLLEQGCKVLNHPECEKMVYVSSTGAAAACWVLHIAVIRY